MTPPPSQQQQERQRQQRQQHRQHHNPYTDHQQQQQQQQQQQHRTSQQQYDYQQQQQVENDTSATVPPPSCERCRQRKVRCDRVHPRCSTCSAAGVRCLYPPGRGRAPKRSRAAMTGRGDGTPHTELAERLARLEELMREAGASSARRQAGNHSGDDAAGGAAAAAAAAASAAANNNNNTSPGAADTVGSSSTSGSGGGGGGGGGGDSLNEAFGRLVVEDTSSYYVSNILWSTLAGEIEEIRDLLTRPSGAPEVVGDMRGNRAASSSSGPKTIDQQQPPGFFSQGDQPSGSSPGDSNAAILGYYAVAHSLRTFHPSLPQAVALFSAFEDNVLPLVHVFHMPSLRQSYWYAMSSLDTIDRSIEALLFAIHYSAIISLERGQCAEVLGTSREEALRHYRFATEQALARADLLNTQDLRVLQAAIVFLMALRNEDESRTAWSLTSLVYHIAQAMGIHRDGEVFGLKPLETELRRRVWWHLCMLDGRSSENHGCEPLVQENSFDTKLPLHINDADLLPDMDKPPAERWDEITDMSIVIVRCETVKCKWRPGVKSGKRPIGAPQEELSAEERDREMDELYGTMMMYVNLCEDSQVPMRRLISTAARLVIEHFRLSLYFTMDSTGGRLDRSQRDNLFETSIRTVEICGEILTDPGTAPWVWYAKTHIPWPGVIFVLAEVCVRPWSSNSDRAWKAASTLYEAWRAGRSDNGGTFAVPIQRLMAKARNAREMSRTIEGGSFSGVGGVMGGGSAPVDTQMPHQPYQQGQSLDWPEPMSTPSWFVTGGGLYYTTEMPVLPASPAGIFPTSVASAASWPGMVGGGGDEGQMMANLDAEGLVALVGLLPGDVEDQGSTIM